MMHDIIDSRDLIAEVEEYERDERMLQEEIDGLERLAGDDDVPPTGARERLGKALQDLALLRAEHLGRVSAIRELKEQVGTEWTYGVTLVHESYFEDHARQLAEDIGAIPDDLSWPATCIDWAQAARELRADYTEVEFEGDTYLART